MKYVVVVAILLFLWGVANADNFTASVAFSSDDAGYDASSINTGSAGMAYGITGGTPNGMALRWRNVTIPQNATITAAKITTTARLTLSGTTCTIKIDGELAGNPATFSTSADLNARTHTSANVAWSPSAQTANLTYDSPDITSVIQEIVNQGGYASGNALVLFVNDNGSTPSPAYRNAYQQDGGTAVVLNVDYTTGGGSGADSLTTKIHSPSGLLNIHSPLGTGKVHKP